MARRRSDSAGCTNNYIEGRWPGNPSPSVLPSLQCYAAKSALRARTAAAASQRKASETATRCTTPREPGITSRPPRRKSSASATAVGSDQRANRDQCGSTRNRGFITIGVTTASAKTGMLNTSCARCSHETSPASTRASQAAVPVEQSFRRTPSPTMPTPASPTSEGPTREPRPPPTPRCRAGANAVVSSPVRTRPAMTTQGWSAVRAASALTSSRRAL
jgi:hypothetical protein